MKIHLHLAVLVLALASLPAAQSAIAQSASLPLHADLAAPASSSSADSLAPEPASSLAAAPSAQAGPAKTAAETTTGGAFSGIGAGVKIGVSGIGFDVATPLVPGTLNLRGGATFFSYSPNITTNDNLDVTGTLKLQNSGVMLDYFPWHGSFRLSGGATVYNNTGINGSITVPGGKSFTLGSTTYYSNPSNPAVGTGVFNIGGKSGGRVSFGWGNMVPNKGRFKVETEFGVQILSAPTVALAFTNACTNSTYTSCGSPTASDITAEQNKLQSDINFLRFYPILSIGFSYRIH
jgi:hypothetical protein